MCCRHPVAIQFNESRSDAELSHLPFSGSSNDCPDASGGFDNIRFTASNSASTPSVAVDCSADKENSGCQTESGVEALPRTEDRLV